MKAGDHNVMLWTVIWLVYLGTSRRVRATFVDPGGDTSGERIPDANEQADGSVAIPAALQPYMGGAEVLGA